MNNTLLFAQFEEKNKTATYYIDSLSILGKHIFEYHTDNERIIFDEQFKNLLIEFVENYKPILSNFSNIKNLSVQTPRNNSFFLFTWVIPKTDGCFKYSGIIYIKDKKNSFKILELNDVKMSQKDIEHQELDSLKWYGALYYDLIPVKINNRNYFTLLGWDGNNSYSRKKIIDVLSFSDDNSPVFGALIFAGYGKLLRRVIFEYSSETQMVLRYEKQAYYKNKQKKETNHTIVNPKTQKDFKAQKQNRKTTKKRTRKKAYMIVFDRLSPINKDMLNMYQFYYPETNIVDGFLFRHKRWEYIPDIDARNPEKEQDNQTQKPIINKIPPAK